MRHRPHPFATIAVLAAALALGGVGVVVGEATARVERVGTAIDEAVARTPGSEYYRDTIATPAFEHLVVVDSLMNDAMPQVRLVPRDGYVGFVFGAFGVADRMTTLTRPWSPPLAAAPLAAGLALGVTLLLVAASRHPSGRRVRRGRAPRAPRDAS